MVSECVCTSTTYTSWKHLILMCEEILKRFAVQKALPRDKYPSNYLQLFITPDSTRKANRNSNLSLSCVQKFHFYPFRLLKIFVFIILSRISFPHKLLSGVLIKPYWIKISNKNSLFVAFHTAHHGFLRQNARSGIPCF